MKQRILITGISKGIGRAIAEDLNSKGFEVFGTSRSIEKIQNRIEGVHYLELNLSSEESIARCFESLPEIDLVINNAGQSQMGPAENISNEKVREIFEVNFFGTIFLTKLFAQRMRERGSGKIVNIGTLSGHFAMPFQSTYGSSKIALTTWSLCLRKEMKPFGVHIVMVEPFYINSGIQLEYICPEDSAYKESADHVYRRRNEKMGAAVSPAELVQTINEILNTKNPKGIYVSERKGRVFRFVKRFLADSTIEKLTLKSLGLKY
jgi:short-subunit dehydrogenase